MIRSFYTSLSGIVAAMDRMAVESDNIANVDTTGFKALTTTQGDFGFELGQSNGQANSQAIGWLGTATVASGLTLDRAQGSLQESGVSTDLAIEGDGLFTVRTASGALAYTRAGDFTFDSTGTLTTQNGEAVLDVTGRPIVSTNGPSTFAVGPDGTVQGTGQRLAVVAWPATGVTRLGNTLYSIPGTTVPGTGVVRQRMLERSNVDLGAAMTNVITIQREMGLASRALSLSDQTLDEANKVGKLRG